MQTQFMDASQANLTLAENLRRLMGERGWTQKQMESASGVKQTTISLYMRPDARIQGKDGKAGSAKLTEVEAVAKAFGLNAWELLRPHSDSQARPTDEEESRLLQLFRQLQADKQNMVLVMADSLASAARATPQDHPQQGLPLAPKKSGDIFQQVAIDALALAEASRDKKKTRA